MKLLIHIASDVTVALAFLLIGKHTHDLAGWQQLILIWGALGLLQILFIPRWPKSNALQEALRLRRGQQVKVKVEIEDR